MEHFVEVIMELLFSLHKDTPDKMPEDIAYNPCFVVGLSTKKIVFKILTTLILICVPVLLLRVVHGNTRLLFIALIILLSIALIFILTGVSFRCFVSEQYIHKSHWGMFRKHLEWSSVSCIRIVEKTNEHYVIIAIYNENGKCIIDLDSELDNAWYVVKMAEVKNIEVKHEKDLSLKQISQL